MLIPKKHNLVYCTTNLVDNSIYIGVHCTDNQNDSYLGSGKLLKRAIRKYGHSNFIRDTLYDVENTELAFFIESILVDADFIKRADTYNVSLGGEGGSAGPMSEYTKQKLRRPRSEETKLRMSVARKGVPKGPPSESHRLNISKAKTGVSRDSFSEEWRRRIAEANKGRTPSIETREKIARSHTGVPKGAPTLQARQNMSKASKGIPKGPYTEERKQNISLAKRGVPIGPFSDEHRRKLAEATSRVWAARRAKSQTTAIPQ